MSRIDQSDFIIHFTKGTRQNSSENAYKNFKQILADNKINAGNYLIKGGHKCVCFTEAPIGCLIQSSENKVCNKKYFERYSPFGFQFSKKYIYTQGGRHVIYSDSHEYEDLPESLKWRHVYFNPTVSQPIDFTWEREWRLRKDELIINPNEVKLVFPNEYWIQRFIQDHELLFHNGCNTCICQRETTIIKFQDLFNGNKTEIIANSCPNPSNFPYILVNMDVKYK